MIEPVQVERNEETGEWIGRVVDPSNGEELVRTSETYKRAGDAEHGLIKAASLIVGYMAEAAEPVDPA